MTDQIKSIVPIAALIAAFGLLPVAPEVGNVAFLIAGGIGLILMWPSIGQNIQRPIVWMPWAGLCLVATAYVVSSGFNGLVGILYFAPLLAIAPLATLLMAMTRTNLARLTGTFALCGVAGATIMALIEVSTTGTSRAGGNVANPIHFADVALLVGFIALVGMAGFRSNWRLIFLAGPVFAAVAIVLSGTRGALVAYVAMVATAAIAMTLLRLVTARTVLFSAIGLLLAVVVALLFGADQLSGIDRVLTDLRSTVIGGGAVDESTRLRLLMYQGGWRAFLQSPLFGHGPAAFAAIADSLADTSFGGAPHLHNDLFDLAASAGLLGLIAYFLFILAPLVEIIRSPAGQQKSWQLALAITLLTGFVVMGITNAMFGILNVTTAFAAVCLVLGGQVRLGESRASNQA